MNDNFKKLVEEHFGLDILTKEYDVNSYGFTGWMKIEAGKLYVLDVCYECNYSSLQIYPIIPLEKLLEITIERDPYRYELIGKIYMSIRNNMGEEGSAEIISEMLESCLDEYIEPYCELNLTCGLKFTGLTGYIFDF